MIEIFHVQFTKYLVRNVSNLIIVYGNNFKKDLISKGVPERKIKVIPHGDHSYYLKWAKNIGVEKNSVLFFGRILDYKGLGYLVNAVIIASTIPNVKIIIVESSYLTKYNSMIYNHKYFEIHNRYIPDEEVAGFFQRSCLAVLPYINGSQSCIIPITYVFKTIILPKLGSILEVVDDVIIGFIIPPNNSEGLA